jgi:hypothetical protein
LNVGDVAARCPPPSMTTSKKERREDASARAKVAMAPDKANVDAYLKKHGGAAVDHRDDDDEDDLVVDDDQDFDDDQAEEGRTPPAPPPPSPEASTGRLPPLPIEEQTLPRPQPPISTSFTTTSTTAEVVNAAMASAAIYGISNVTINIQNVDNQHNVQYIHNHNVSNNDSTPAPSSTPRPRRILVEQEANENDNLVARYYGGQEVEEID